MYYFCTGGDYALFSSSFLGSQSKKLRPHMIPTLLLSLGSTIICRTNAHKVMGTANTSKLLEIDYRDEEKG
jgi:hypothetical protein